MVDDLRISVGDAKHTLHDSAGADSEIIAAVIAKEYAGLGLAFMRRTRFEPQCGQAGSPSQREATI